jgi:hypothetical protein
MMLKSNCLVSLSKEEGHIHLDNLEWTPEWLKFDVIVKLKKVLSRSNGSSGLP